MDQFPEAVGGIRFSLEGKCGTGKTFYGSGWASPQFFQEPMGLVKLSTGMGMIGQNFGTR